MNFDAELEKLNEQQKQAVITTEGYIRVIAGAGSGKTGALACRYAYLVKKVGIPPSDILCVTFTNKAAGEMKKRIRQMIGDVGIGYITTFHGFCVQLLKEDIHFVQYSPNFVILDDDDIDTILTQCFDKLGISSKQLTVRNAKIFIEKVKNRVYLEDKSGDVRQDFDYLDYLVDPQMSALLKRRKEVSSGASERSKVFWEYIYEQRKANALDYTDLIKFALHILKNNTRVREKWQQRLQYVMVDEFQDVNNEQYTLAQILSDYNKNLFVVGDPDQTIYTWRGAEVQYIIDFDKKYPDAKTIEMNTNYRSFGKIIEASNSLIRWNENRIKKSLIPHYQENGQAIYFHAKTEKDEAEWVIKQIKAIKEHGTSLSKVAVLYRAHSVSRSIEESLINNRLPYTVYKSVPFYQRKEIKDVLGYLRLLINHKDDLSFLRVINKPPRGIGRTRIDFLKDYSENNRCSCLDALSENINLSHFAETKASAFLSMIKKFQEAWAELSLTDLVNAILNESGYEEYMRTTGDEERLEIFNELKQSIYTYETTAGEKTDLASYLHSIALYTDSDQEDKPDTVKLMTIHSAKGLEFPYVFVCGLSEGIFPSSKAFDREKLEEERRLAYVAYTRAENVLFLTDSEGYNQDGSFRRPSRFIFDTGEVNLDYVVPLPPNLVDKRESANSDSPRNVVSIFSVGTRIQHEILGRGKILSVNEDRQCYNVSFESGTTRRISFFNAPIKKIETE